MCQLGDQREGDWSGSAGGHWGRWGRVNKPDDQNCECRVAGWGWIPLFWQQAGIHTVNTTTCAASLGIWKGWHKHLAGTRWHIQGYGAMDRPDCRERTLKPAMSVGPIAKDILFEPSSILGLVPCAETKAEFPPNPVYIVASAHHCTCECAVRVEISLSVMTRHPTQDSDDDAFRKAMKEKKERNLLCRLCRVDSGKAHRSPSSMA